MGAVPIRYPAIEIQPEHAVRVTLTAPDHEPPRDTAGSTIGLLDSRGYGKADVAMRL